jgi:2',3'-cyclic-nucleotide 2'-phosphodiesterase (5'-nucleotidase family)
MRVEKTAADKKLEKIIVPYRIGLREKLAEDVVYSDFSMEKGLPESELTNVIADAVFETAKKWSIENQKALPDMCMLNMGGIRTALPMGMLNVGHMYEVMPFENEIVLLQLTPENVRALANYIAEKGGSPVAGIRLKIDGNRADQVELNGSPFLYDRNVWVATSDFLAFGGDDMDFFDAPLVFIETKIKVRDAITTYFKSFRTAGKSLGAIKDGRIYK